MSRSPRHDNQGIGKSIELVALWSVAPASRRPDGRAECPPDYKIAEQAQANSVMAIRDKLRILDVQPGEARPAACV